MNIDPENSMYRIACFFLIFLFFNSCDEKAITFLPSPEDGLDFINQSFDVSLDNSSSFTMTPQYINQDLAPLLYVGYIPELDDSSYALFEINSKILEDYGLCNGAFNSDGSLDELNAEENQEIITRGDIKFRLVSSDIYAENLGLIPYYYDDSQIIDFSEGDPDNHDAIRITQIVTDIKAQAPNNILDIELDENYPGIMYVTLFDADECLFEDNQGDCDENIECTWGNENSECSSTNNDSSSSLIDTSISIS